MHSSRSFIPLISSRPSLAPGEMKSKLARAVAGNGPCIMCRRHNFRLPTALHYNNRSTLLQKISGKRRKTFVFAKIVAAAPLCFRRASSAKKSSVEAVIYGRRQIEMWR